MTKLIKNNQKGFTLIELMIVVAIIGILAAIAIPNFLQYQLKAKTAESKTNLGAIRTSEEAYAAENDQYLGAASQPAGNATAAKTPWAAGAASGFTLIGYRPAGAVYYRYGVSDGAAIAAPAVALAAVGADDAVGAGTAPTAGVVELQINAMGDLDGNAAPGGFTMTDENPDITDLAPGVF